MAEELARLVKYRGRVFPRSVGSIFPISTLLRATVSTAEFTARIMSSNPNNSACIHRRDFVKRGFVGSGKIVRKYTNGRTEIRGIHRS